MSVAVHNSISVANVQGATFTSQPIRLAVSQHLYEGKFASLGIVGNFDVYITIEEAEELSAQLASVINETKKNN